MARGGLFLDKNPVQDQTFDPQLPDNNRYALSLGGGYKIGMMRLDASYMLLNLFDRDKDNGVGIEKDITGDGIVNRFDVPPGYPVANGRYESRSHLFSVSASFSF